MTCRIENNHFDLAMEVLIENGFDGVADAVSLLMNTAMQIERSRYLQAEPYEGLIPTKVRNAPQDFSPSPVCWRFGGIFCPPKRCYVQAAIFGGRIPTESLSFSSEKPYSPRKVFLHNVPN